MTTALFRWDGLNATAVAAQFGLPRVHMYSEVESTLDVAHEMAEQGTPAGTLIVADAQRSGRGRMGRSWSSQPGRGVWCTIVEKPRDPKALDVLSLRVGLHCAEAFDAIVGERVGVKWPNDLVLAGNREPRAASRFKKLGGVLVEVRWAGAVPAWAAIGVGVNVIAPDDIETAAGMPPGVRRIDVLSAIVSAVRSASRAAGHLSASELARYAARHTLVGKRVVSPAAGTVEGVSPDGALMVRGATGVEQVRAGTVELAEDS